MKTHDPLLDGIPSRGADGKGGPPGVSGVLFCVGLGQLIADQSHLIVIEPDGLNGWWGGLVRLCQHQRVKDFSLPVAGNGAGQGAQGRRSGTDGPRCHRDDRDELILDLLRNAGEMVSTRCAEAPVLFAKRLRRDVD
jgi:hypothetical protein